MGDDARDQVQMRKEYNYFVVMEGDTGSRWLGELQQEHTVCGVKKQAVHRAQHLREAWSVDQVTRLCEAAWEYQ